jgi:hypothetical protein
MTRVRIPQVKIQRFLQMQVLRFAEKVFTFVLMTRYLWIGAVVLSLLALREANSSQPPVARTGAPFDNGSCGSCHRGGSPAPTITLLANGNPVDGTLGYVPGGSPITMEVRVNHGSASIGGFELTVATLPTGSPANDATPANGLTAGRGSTILAATGGRKYLGHQGAQSFSNGTVSWLFTWTPPSSDMGTLRWYVAANAANGDGTTSGDATAAVTFDMPVSGSSDLAAQTDEGRLLYWYDPHTQMLMLRGAQVAEIYSLEGRLVLTLRGEGPHPLGHLSGVYLLRLYREGAAPFTVRVWLP